METENVVEDINVKIADIENTLKQIIDFSGPFVDNGIIERLVYQIIPNKKDRMTWILNLADISNVTKKNFETAQDSLNSSKELSNYAEELNELVTKFSNDEI